MTLMMKSIQEVVLFDFRDFWKYAWYFRIDALQNKRQYFIFIMIVHLKGLLKV